MSSKSFVRVAGLLGASSVGAAAYGAHGTAHLDEGLKQVYANGNKLHMFHSAAIFAGAGAAKSLRFPTATLGLFTLGFGFFSGSCYAAAVMEDRSAPLLGPCAAAVHTSDAWSPCVPQVFWQACARGRHHFDLGVAHTHPIDDSSILLYVSFDFRCALCFPVVLYALLSIEEG